MFGFVIVFQFMEKIRPSAGATYIYGRNVLHSVLGYLAGWSLVTASIIFGLVSTVPGSTSLLLLFTNNQTTIRNVYGTMLIGAFIFIFLVAIIAYGIKVTSKAQVVMMVVELGLWPALSGLFPIAVLVKVIPTLSHLSLWMGIGTIAIGVIPMSIYWIQGSSHFHAPTKEERRETLLEFKTKN